ncbi:MAG: hypothetical protein AAFV90_29930 [Cyanobacteria bacterium J06634_5]
MADIMRDRISDTGSDHDFIQSQKGLDTIATTSNDDRVDCIDDDILTNVTPTKNLICLMIGISTT